MTIWITPGPDVLLHSAQHNSYEPGVMDAASPAAPAQVPALVSFGEVAEKGHEEREVIALETIAEALADAVKLWIVSKMRTSRLIQHRINHQQLSQRGEEEKEEDDEDEDEEEENKDN